MENNIVDVLVVGGGIAGAAIARELARYKVNVILLEKGSDVASGISKGSHGAIYKGLRMAGSLVLKSVMNPDKPVFKEGDPKLEIADKGYKLMDQVVHELDVHHQHIGSIVIAKNKDHLKRLIVQEQISLQLGSKVERIDGNQIQQLEPNITSDVITALYEEDDCLEVFPPELVIALIENAKENGVKILCNTEVLGIEQKKKMQIVRTNNGKFITRFVVNAAGRFADMVAKMGGCLDDWGLSFNKSQMILLDRKLEGIIKNYVSLPPEEGKFKLVMPLASGNIYIACSSYNPVLDREDSATTNYESLKESIEQAREMIPSISENDVITFFSGVRAFNTRNPDEHLVEPGRNNPYFINVVLRMPGFGASLIVAQKVLSILAEQGLSLVEKSDFLSTRKAIPRFRNLSNDEKNKLIKHNPKYGNVVCRCEMVTEGEIREAVQRGAQTMQGVQYRTRAGMGRCQGGVCGPQVVRILADELGVPMTQITKKGGNSFVLKTKTKAPYMCRM